MDFQDLISTERILFLNGLYKDKQELLGEMLRCCLKDTDVERCREDIWDTLLERELSMSTGIGLGVAIPHCSTEHVETPQAWLALLGSGVDFQGIDEVPVRLVILLILPKNKFDRHVKTLASIAKLFNAQDFRNEVLETTSSEQAYDVILSRTN